MTTVLQEFTSNVSLTDNFTQSNPASGTFTWNNTTGLSSSPGISVSLGSDQVWTTNRVIPFRTAVNISFQLFSKVQQIMDTVR